VHELCIVDAYRGPLFCCTMPLCSGNECFRCLSQAGEEGSAAQRSAQLPADAQQTIDRNGGLASMLVHFILAAMRHGGDAGILVRF